jgi:hypothetical protein
MSETQAVTPGASGTGAQPAKEPSQQNQILFQAAFIWMKNSKPSGPDPKQRTANIETLARDLKATAGKPYHEALKAAVMGKLSPDERARLQAALQGSRPGNGAGQTAPGGGLPQQSLPPKPQLSGADAILRNSARQVSESAGYGTSQAPARTPTAAPPLAASSKPADARVQAWSAAARALDTSGSPPSAQAAQAAKEAGVNLVRSAIKEGRPELIAQARAAEGAEAFDRHMKAAGLNPYYVSTTERILSAAKAGDAKALEGIAAEVDGKLKEGQGGLLQPQPLGCPLIARGKPC